MQIRYVGITDQEYIDANNNKPEEIDFISDPRRYCIENLYYGLSYIIFVEGKKPFIKLKNFKNKYFPICAFDISVKIICDSKKTKAEFVCREYI